MKANIMNPDQTAPWEHYYESKHYETLSDWEHFIMEANIMIPDQTAPLGEFIMEASIMNPYQTAPLVHIVRKIDYLMKISRRQKSYKVEEAI